LIGDFTAFSPHKNPSNEGIEHSPTCRAGGSTNLSQPSAPGVRVVTGDFVSCAFTMRITS
jgi:hypothetical protein